MYNRIVGAVIDRPPGLPLWGRWHAAGVTEEVQPLPPPFGGTLSKGEGIFCCKKKSGERICVPRIQFV